MLREKMSLDRFMVSSPSHATTSHSRVSLSTPTPLTVQEKYLLELLDEKENFAPFVSMFPNAFQLLYKEALLVHTLLGNASISSPSGHSINGEPFSSGGTNSQSWTLACEINRMKLPNTMRFRLQNSRDFANKTIKIGIPVDKYPSFNFIGRLLGPRGNTLKRLEKALCCRILIRGRGSLKDPNQEEMLRHFQGNEHLNESLHIIVEARLPKDIIDICLTQAREVLEAVLQPVDETQDILKHEQLRELAILNGKVHAERLYMPNSVTPTDNRRYLRQMGIRAERLRGNQLFQRDS